VRIAAVFPADRRAVLLTVLWAAMLAGAVPTPRLPGGPIAWHAHELIFGFALASVVGFLLTAVPEFTGTREAPPALTVQLVRAPRGRHPSPDSELRLA
jgi:uncharacterized protein involved in response to NO